MQKEITVLSLFDGLGGAYLALTALGYKVNYFASEIDKHAVKVTSAKIPNITHLGDVTKWREWKLPKIELLVGGSPCQGFSFAGKGLNFDDPRSKLFFEYADIKNHLEALNPNLKFLLENVRMKMRSQEVITRHLGVHPVNINSALVSAQNRDRYYWTNIFACQFNLFGEMKSNIPQPKDEKIFLKDILQADTEVDKKYYISDKVSKWLHERANERNSKVKTLNGNDKAGCISATDVKCNLQTNYIDLPFIQQSAHGKNEGNQFEDKSPTLLGNAWEHNNHLVFTENYLQYDVSGKGYKSQQDRAFYPNGKHGTVSANRGDSKAQVLLNPNQAKLNIRRLTPVEVCRLQTISDDWFFDETGKQIVSDSQIYKMCGNGFTVKVISHILSFYGKEKL